jgi:hypothetical protein
MLSYSAAREAAPEGVWSAVLFGSSLSWRSCSLGWWSCSCSTARPASRAVSLVGEDFPINSCSWWSVANAGGAVRVHRLVLVQFLRELFMSICLCLCDSCSWGCWNCSGTPTLVSSSSRICTYLFLSNTKLLMLNYY